MAHKTFIAIAGERFGSFPFNEAMLQLFLKAARAGIHPEAYRECLPAQDRWKIWVARRVDRYADLLVACQSTPQADHKRKFLPDRFYLRDQEIVSDPIEPNTKFVMSNQWGFPADGRNRNEFLPKLQATFPQLHIGVTIG